MNKKQIIKVIVFLLILAVLVFFTGNLLIAKWKAPCFESVVQKEFYELEENSVEVLFLGSSQVSEGIAPPQLYDEYGISSYVIGSASQPIQVPYMWLKEAHKTQDMEVVVLDISRLYQPSPTVWYHKGIDNMKLSWDKIKDMWDYCSTHEEADPLLSYLVPLYMYHSRWAELTEDDFRLLEQDNNVFMGFYVRPNNKEIDPADMAYENETSKSETKMVDYQFEYLEKIVAYCKEKDQKLLFIKTPKIDWSVEKHDQVQAYADANGIPFVDFSSEVLIEEMGLDGKLDFGDGDHLSALGAEKLTAWLGNYLKENYDLTDYRGTEYGETLQAEFERYTRHADFCKAKLRNDVNAYFECLNNDRYEVLIQLTSPEEGLYTAEMTQLMQSLGLTVDMEALDGQRYLAWIQKGEVKYEGTADKAFEFADKFASGKGFRMYGDFDDTATTKMRVNFEDVEFERRGLNILVYDNETDKIMNTYTVYAKSSGALRLD